MNIISTILSPLNEIADKLGANDLPYAIPIHPNLVHFTIGLFAIGIAFDFAGAFYPLEKRVFRFLALPATRSGFHDVGWYNLLACSVITFFTVGPKEARAWTVRREATAPQAAGVIHSDFERGFIRAETIAYDDFERLGGEQGAKDNGRMRVEGAEYLVKDGDVFHFRFNV